MAISIKSFLKSLGLSLTLASASLGATREAVAQTQHQRKELVQEARTIRNRNRGRELEKELALIEIKQKEIERLAEWLDQAVLPLLGELKMKYELALSEQEARNWSIEALKQARRDLAVLKRLRADIQTQKYGVLAEKTMGEEMFKAFLIEFNKLIKQIEAALIAGNRKFA